MTDSEQTGILEEEKQDQPDEPSMTEDEKEQTDESEREDEETSVEEQKEGDGPGTEGEESGSSEEKGQGETSPDPSTGVDAPDAVVGLVQLMDEHELGEVEYEDDDRRIRLQKQGHVEESSPAVYHPPAAQAGPTGQQPPAGGGGHPQASPQGTPPEASQEAADEKGDDDTAGDVPDEDLEIITSPLVGTFYRAPSPESDPFVEEGDRVDEDTVVCIIEAMKVMNEIKAEVSGTVHRVLVQNGKPVDFDQPIFEIVPDD